MAHPPGENPGSATDRAKEVRHKNILKGYQETGTDPFEMIGVRMIENQWRGAFLIVINPSSKKYRAAEKNFRSIREP